MMSSMKPAPLQFVKLAPSDLYRSAQDQLNKTAAVVVKPKPKEFDADWQSDLDNWKSNRRKQQEHIIERLVEVKKFETDRLDDGFRKRSKTFNEMIQERGRSGRLRSLPALYQDDDDGNDLSDLGLSTSKKNCVDDYDEDEMQRNHTTEDDHHSHSKDSSSEERVLHQLDFRSENLAEEDEDVFRGAKEPAAVAVKMATVQTIATVVGPATEPVVVENGYDRAIKDYVDFAESKRTSVAKCEEQTLPCRKPAVAEIRRRMSAPKIEEKVMLLKTRSQSTKDLNSAAGELPKVDIVKRREIFEKICSETKATDVQHNVAARQPSLVKKKFLKESPTSSPPPASVAATVTDVFPEQMVEDIIYSPESPLPETEPSKVVETQDEQQMTYSSEEEIQIQHRGLAVDSEVESEITAVSTEEEMMTEEEKPIVALEKERVCMVEDEYHHHLDHIRHHQQLSSLSDLVSRHSIDSLDQECGHTAEDPDDGNYPGSCLSAEDSGVHTEDMSSCVSQADDEERSNLQPSPVLLQQLPNVVQQHVDDTYNMVLELTPVNALEPPKEKPPPPPVDAYPDDDSQVQLPLEPAVDSLESAKRIKKEMWMKRSSFLGLEEYTNGNSSYEHDLENLKSKPPDLTSFLEEERRLEKLLYNQNKPERQSHDTTRIYENVNSIPSQNVYVDDGGDSESSQYMRDILQVEEQSRCNQLKNKAAQNNIGEKLVKKLKELEEDLNNQECARVGSAHWLPPPTRHSMQDISSAASVANAGPKPPTLDHTQSMPNLEQQQPAHNTSQHHQPEDFTWSSQNGCPRPVQQNVYAKRKPINNQSEKYNYQHWLIQEAEHRRLVDRCNRQVVPPGAIASNQPRSRTRPALPPPPPPAHNKKPLPDSVINTLTQRVQDRLSFNDFHRHDHIASDAAPQESMLSVSGKKKCSHCSVELGRGAAMIIESLQLFYHIECFKCCVCCVQLGDGLMGTDVRVRNKKLHCHNCFSSDDGTSCLLNVNHTYF
ncbi:LIM and calponin homology domains-containing protein 1 isoform X1 [Aphis gossypii]|uniref:LIM and calponin homology domains-containing protein 1 isoform X1 n=1 Tax=Aphis gossypii TaxID=80765 RepID=UPI0021595759|nr:LIM and calponin homology domains-containing protein 1 isoform X1 [Aphis gossypii]